MNRSAGFRFFCLCFFLSQPQRQYRTRLPDAETRRDRKLDGDDHPVGAAVVTDRPLTVRATLEIQSAIQALLDIDLDRIRVIGMGGL